MQTFFGTFLQRQILFLSGSLMNQYKYHLKYALNSFFPPLLCLFDVTGISFCSSVSPDQTVAQLLHVCGVTGAFSGQNASMDGRMESLHSAPQHLRMTSQLRHIPATQRTHYCSKKQHVWHCTLHFELTNFRGSTWQPVSRPSGLWQYHPKPRVTDPHPPNV